MGVSGGTVCSQWGVLRSGRFLGKRSENYFTFPSYSTFTRQAHYKAI